MWTVVAVLGWLTALFMGLLLLALTARWRTALGTTEWVLAPIDDVRKATARLEELSDVSVQAVQEARVAREAVTETRDEFEILRQDLAEKSQELRDLRLGGAYHARRPLLLAIARTTSMIGEDHANGVAPDQTLAGIRVDLAETLDDNRVEIVAPTVGSDFDQRGVDMAYASTEETVDEDLVGTIASVDGPAYIYRGPEAEDILIPARVRVYRTKEA